ncbi:MULTISPECIES: hypothetical protein [Rahnella]|uniref:Phage tail protein n=1 Tax=Rahnella laticis TaxID=2787622 RepID=A0ABS0E0N2_9GAMM|nr:MULTISPECIES: hypothetical protein [Rahnella]MBF7978653.1 hypothetical protein [Rahnella laticis]MBF7998743.1 hypothetical protein [Rahnella sp. LAC-M12]
MQKIGSITSTADVNGEWTNGNVAAGTPPTILDAAWMNTVQRELANVVTGAGMALSPANDAQVLAALKSFISQGTAGLVGDMRNGKMSIPTASATATFTADEIIIETALGGFQYRLSSFSKTINLATTGAGGMDTGTVTSGYIAIYAIYNPTTGASALLATLTGTSAGSIYSGSNMPSGYTASALVSTWLVSSSQLTAGYQIDRDIYTTSLSAISTSAATTTPAVITFASAAFPVNAKTISGYGTVTAQANQTAEIWILSLPVIGQGVRCATNASAIAAGGIGQTFPLSKIPITSPQKLYLEAFASTSSSFPYAVNITGYSI